MLDTIEWLQNNVTKEKVTNEAFISNSYRHARTIDSRNYCWPRKICHYWVAGKCHPKHSTYMHTHCSSTILGAHIKNPIRQSITWLTEYATFLVDAGTSHTRPAIHQTERSSTHAAASGTFRRQNQGEEIRPWCPMCTKNCARDYSVLCLIT